MNVKANVTLDELLTTMRQFDRALQADIVELRGARETAEPGESTKPSEAFVWTSEAERSVRQRAGALWRAFQKVGEPLEEATKALCSGLENRFGGEHPLVTTMDQSQRYLALRTALVRFNAALEDAIPFERAAAQDACLSVDLRSGVGTWNADVVEPMDVHTLAQESFASALASTDDGLSRYSGELADYLFLAMDAEAVVDLPSFTVSTQDATLRLEWVVPEVSLAPDATTLEEDEKTATQAALFKFSEELMRMAGEERDGSQESERVMLSEERRDLRAELEAAVERTVCSLRELSHVRQTHGASGKLVCVSLDETSAVSLRGLWNKFAEELAGTEEGELFLQLRREVEQRAAAGGLVNNPLS